MVRVKEGNEEGGKRKREGERREESRSKREYIFMPMGL